MKKKLKFIWEGKATIEGYNKIQFFLWSPEIAILKGKKIRLTLEEIK